MREVTVLASVIPTKSKSVIRKLSKVRKLLEDEFNIRLNLIITEGGVSKNLIYIEDDVIEGDAKLDIIVEKIIEKVSGKYNIDVGLVGKVAVSALGDD